MFKLIGKEIQMGPANKETNKDTIIEKLRQFIKEFLYSINGMKMLNEDQLHWDHPKFLREINKHRANQKLLYEGLLHSYDISYVKKNLKKLGFQDTDIKTEDTYGKTIILLRIVISKNTKDIIKKLKQSIENLCGWRLGAILNEKFEAQSKDFPYLTFLNKVFYFQYEPKFDIDRKSVV